MQACSLTPGLVEACRVWTEAESAQSATILAYLAQQIPLTSTQGRRASHCLALEERPSALGYLPLMPLLCRPDEGKPVSVVVYAGDDGSVLLKCNGSESSSIRLQVWPGAAEMRDRLIGLLESLACMGGER